MWVRQSVLAFLFLAPLLGKISVYWEDPAPGHSRLHDQLLGFLLNNAASGIELTPLSMDGQHILVTATHSDCPEGFKMMTSPQSGEASSLAAALFNDHHIAYLYREGAYRDPPKLRIILHDEFSLIKRRMRIGGEQSYFSFLVLATPQNCWSVRDLPWGRLWRTD